MVGSYAKIFNHELTWSDLCLGRKGALEIKLGDSCHGVGEQLGPLHVIGRRKGEGWTRKSILPLKMMKLQDELDTKDHCGVLFLEYLLNWVANDLMNYIFVFRKVRNWPK